jgi:hypothetical protein
MIAIMGATSTPADAAATASAPNRHGSPLVFHALPSIFSETVMLDIDDSAFVNVLSANGPTAVTCYAFHLLSSYSMVRFWSARMASIVCGYDTTWRIQKMIDK